MADTLTWLLIFFMMYWGYCFFWGIRALRRSHTASDYFLANRRLSPWVFSLAVTAITLAGWSFIAHPALVFRDGFQFVNTSFYGIAVALSGVILLKRQWMLGQRFGYMTSGEMFTDYFKSHTLNNISIGIALLFGIPFVALLFSASGFLISELTDNAIPREPAMWVLSSFVLLYAITGGMQAIAKIAVVQCVLFAFGVVVLGFYSLELVGGFDTLNKGLANMAQNLFGQWGTSNGNGGGNFPGYFAIPGVIQWNAGLGVEAPDGGPWTAIMCLTFMMSVMGIAASPAISMWGFASQSPRGFAIHQVWGAAFSVGFILVLFATLLGVSAHLLGATAEVNDSGMVANQYLPVLGSHEGNKLIPHFIKLISDGQPWLIGVFAVCAIAALQATAAAFMSTTGNILTRDIYRRYIKPEANHQQQIKAARLCTGLVFLAAVLLATYSFEAAFLLGGLAIAFGFQLWPSLLAVTWFPWITRQAASLGLIVGLIAVVMTEPMGQKLAGDALPWGRWPWTIHSAAWGMFFNIIVCLLVSAMSRDEVDRGRRNRFHAFFADYSTPIARKRWSKPVAGVIVLVWIFFAIGPGAVIGNILFGEPNAGYEAWKFGMPSIWAWQIIWWALGVGMIWYLAYKMEMSTDLERDIERMAGHT
jgi:Na+/proline symporter